MEKRVAIAGYKQTKLSKESPVSRERIYYNLAKSIYEELKITPDDIDTFVFSSNDFMDGRTISEVYLVQRVGAYMKDETKVEMEGLNAVSYATMRILSGQYKTALVLSVTMSGSEFKPLLVQNQTLDPVYERARGLINFISASALQAQAYLLKNKMTERHLGMYALKNLKNANKNPNAIQQEKIPSIGEILASKPIYMPIREAYIPPFVDGGGAVLLASEDRARELTDKPVWIDGFGYCQDTYYLGERDLLKLPSLRYAAKSAYKLAGIKKPEKDISFAEILTNFVSEEAIIAEGLGLFPEGSGAKVIENGFSEKDGKLPVNPSGGTIGGNPMNSGGMLRLIEAVSQLRGEAGPLQVKNAKRAVVHSQDGICAQHNVVFVLSN